MEFGKTPIACDYAEELKAVELELNAKRKALQLPPLTESADQALQLSGISFTAYRVIKYLFAHQGSRTDHIAAICAAGNVSDAVIGHNKRHTEALKRIGLSAYCEKVKSVNRFGRKTTIGIWWVEISDQSKWKAAQESAAKAQQAA